MDEHERQLIANFSKSMASMCVRNTMLEDIHSGIEPTSHTGDDSDVVVIDADGRRLPWRSTPRGLAVGFSTLKNPQSSSRLPASALR